MQCNGIKETDAVAGKERFKSRVHPAALERQSNDIICTSFVLLRKFFFCSHLDND